MFDLSESSSGSQRLKRGSIRGPFSFGMIEFAPQQWVVLVRRPRKCRERLLRRGLGVGRKDGRRNFTEGEGWADVG